MTPILAQCGVRARLRGERGVHGHGAYRRPDWIGVSLKQADGGQGVQRRVHRVWGGARRCQFWIGEGETAKSPSPLCFSPAKRVELIAFNGSAVMPGWLRSSSDEQDAHTILLAPAHD